jgi:intein-encoded DNA endonuclease-like protein
MRIKKLKKGFEKLTKEKARIIAHLIGDGAHYITNHDYVLKYEVIDEELLKSFEFDLIKTYGLKPYLEYNKSGKTGKLIPFVRLRSKLAFYDLLRYATYFSKDWNIKPLLVNSSNLIRKEFLKALFDDEGSVINQGKKKIIRLYSINLNGLKQVKDILFDFKIESKIVSGFGSRRNVYGLVIKDIDSFRKKVGFNLKRKRDKLI